MAKHVRHADFEHLLKGFRYDPIKGTLERVVGVYQKNIGPVAITHNDGKPYFLFMNKRYFLVGLIAWYLWGEHVPIKRIRFADGDPINIKADNYIRMSDEDKFCPSCNKTYKGPPATHKKRYRLRCASCRKNPEKNHLTKIKRYNLTPEKFNALYEQQAGKCKICDKEESLPRMLAIDHCHKTGHVRGLLCQKCNTGLGMFGDNPKRLLTAAKYLLANT